MEIVGSNYFLRNLRNLNFFTLDLGKARKDPKTDQFRKLDEFIVRYKTIYNREIMKFGRIGDRIIFYEDLSIDKNQYVVFKDSDIYEITYTSEEIIDLEDYILSTLRKIDESEKEELEDQKHNQTMIKDIVGNDGWIAKDDKNFGKSYIIDQTLSKEDYLKAVKEKFMK